MITDIIPRGGILFAPLEGITDAVYRTTVAETCPGWDSLACDFLRVPAAGHYPARHIRAHMGENFLNDPTWVKKTMFQVLASEKSFSAEIAAHLQQLGIQWVDLNIGCPSKTVCKSGGGSFLLTDLPLMARIVRDIRKNFHGHFTCKVRVGWDDGKDFEETIRVLNAEGAEMITVHGRTREQMYKEPANWKWIERAVAVSQVPVVGNGDVWCAEDAHRMLAQTGCHAVMVARGAMKSPWFPLYFKDNCTDTPELRQQMARIFLKRYSENLAQQGVNEPGLVRQLKAITRYMLDDAPGGQVVRRNVLLSHSKAAIFQHLEIL